MAASTDVTVMRIAELVPGISLFQYLNSLIAGSLSGKDLSLVGKFSSILLTSWLLLVAVIALTPLLQSSKI